MTRIVVKVVQKVDTALLRALKLSLNFKRASGKQGNASNDLIVLGVWREKGKKIKLKYKARDKKVYIDEIDKLEDIDVQMLIKMIDFVESPKS